MRLDQIPDPVQRERQLDYNRAIAQKIRNRLQQLENANDNDKKRWVWELLQNAKDTVKDRKVDIEIVVNENYIEFKHNGGYFNARNITNLIHQISSKVPHTGRLDPRTSPKSRPRPRSSTQPRPPPRPPPLPRAPCLLPRPPRQRGVRNACAGCLCGSAMHCDEIVGDDGTCC